MDEKKLNIEKKINESEKIELDDYTENYKSDLGINIRNYDMEEFFKVNDIPIIPPKKDSWFTKLLRILCLKK